MVLLLSHYGATLSVLPCFVKGRWGWGRGGYRQREREKEKSKMADRAREKREAAFDVLSVKRDKDEVVTRQAPPIVR